MFINHPPNSNRGVTNWFFLPSFKHKTTGIKMPPKITHSIDWFQYSIAWPNEVSEWPLHPAAERALAATATPRIIANHNDLENIDKPEKGNMAGYSRMYDFDYCTVHVNPKRRDQKIGVRFTGQELALYRDLGGKEAQLCRFAHEAHAEPSRIDIAFDFFDYGIALDRISDDYKDGKVVARCRTMRKMSTTIRDDRNQQTEAITLYFGSRTSDTMVRMYDKGKERNTDLDWKRIEIECKGEVARAMLADMVRTSVHEVGRTMLKNYFPKMPYKFWRDAMKGESVELTQVKRKLTNRQAWIIEVVLPVLREEVAHEWDGCTETGITREIEALIRDNWHTRATAIRKQYGLL